MGRNKKGPSSLRMCDLNFNAPFVLMLMFLFGVLLKFATGHLPIPEFWCDIISVLGDGVITTTVLGFFVSISTERDTIKNFSEEICSHIDVLWKNDYFPVRLAKPIGILNTEDIAGNSGIPAKELRDSFQNYIKDIAQYADDLAEQLVYIHNFTRQVSLHIGGANDFVEVYTITDAIYVNLSRNPYKAAHNPQFLKTDGSGPSYQIIQMEVNGADQTKKAQESLRQMALKPIFESSVYEHGKGYDVEVPAHQAIRIHLKTVHKMPLSMFFQSKVFDIPCMNFSLTANLHTAKTDGDAIKNLTFRYQLFETKAPSSKETIKTQKAFTEGCDGPLHLSGKYMKPGSGYAITLGFSYDANSLNLLGKIRGLSNEIGVSVILEEAIRWKEQADLEKRPDLKETPKREFEKAKLLFEYVLLMEPSNPEALKEYGGLYYNAKQYAKALEKWKALLAQKKSAYHCWLCAHAASCMGDMLQKGNYRREGLNCPDEHDGKHEKLQGM